MYIPTMNKHSITKILNLEAETNALAQTLKQQPPEQINNSGRTVSEFENRILFLVRKLPFEYCSSLLLLVSCGEASLKSFHASKLERILSDWEQAVSFFKNYFRSVNEKLKPELQKLWESRCADIRRRELTPDQVKAVWLAYKHIEDIKALRDNNPGVVDSALDQIESLPEFKLPPVPHVDIDKLFSVLDQEEVARCQELRPQIFEKSTKIWQIWVDVDGQLAAQAQEPKE
jgi:hypothetical protein